MRLLITNKPIPVAYLKAGLDQGAYDAEKLIWLPGRTTPIRVPDLKLAGKSRKGVRDGTVAPPVKPGLYVPPGYIKKSLSGAALAAKE